MSILTWNDVYHQIWTQAAQSRGTVTCVGQPTDAEGEGYCTIPEWPRTIGTDVIAIATLVDPILGTLPLRLGGFGITRLWQCAVIELEEAFAQSSAEYVHNRSLWSTLLAVASYLDTQAAPIPTEPALEALFDVLWSPVELRNASGPTTKTIIEGTTEKMWTAQRDELMKLRGFDVREPTAAIGGIAMNVPRTTNADAVRLADYWGKEVLALLRKSVTSGKYMMGLDGQLKRWSVVMDDVDKLARKGKRDEIYPKNHELWYETRALATNLAVWEEGPRQFELVVDATTQAVSDLPGRIAGAAGAVAKVVGDVAREAGAGLLSGLGKPLLIGGGVLVGVWLLLRSRRPSEAT